MVWVQGQYTRHFLVPDTQALTEWAWVFDKDCMACRNVENDVVVVFGKVGNVFIGKLRDMSMDLFGKIAELEYGKRIIADIANSVECELFRYLGN